MKNKDLTVLKKGIELCGKLEGAKFAYVLSKNYKKVTEEIQHLQSSLEPTEEYREFEHKRIALCEKYGDLNSETNKFDIEDNDSFVKEYKELSEEYAETIAHREQVQKDYDAILDEPCELALVRIPMDIVPDNITVEAMDCLSFIIDGD